MNKIIRYIIEGVILVVLFFTSASMVPSKIDYDTYSKASQEKKSNSALLDESKEKVKELETEIENIKNEITTLNTDIETLSTTPVEEMPSVTGDNSETSTSTTGATSKIHFIDTGNSDAILIQGSKNVLIDGGDNNDESMLVQYLKKQGIQKLDYMIATHPHADHIGGLDAVINALPVENLLVANGSADTKTYKDFINAAANKGLNPSVPLEGAKFELGDGAYMQVYNSNGGSNTNEQSLVTLYVNGNDKALFTGDAESEAENEV
ncbi:MAG: MBL fold metallo-hydrolase, partial [Sarcina sp.]